MVAQFVDRVDFLNITLDNLTMTELLSRLADGGVVVTPNVDHLIRLQKDPEFHQVYRYSDFVVCDSKILYYAARLAGRPVQEKISGSDLFPAFYEYYKDDPDVRIFLLGGPPGVAEVAQQKINEKVGREMVVASYSPPFGFEQDAAENEKIIQLVKESGATVLAVGLGAPKQEKWIHKYKSALPEIKVFLAIGATINFEAGYVPRAPQWMSQSGLEWMYRLLSEPRRLWKRYLVDDLPFLWLLMQQLTKRYEYRMPIGQILIDAGLLTMEQVEFVIKQQAHNPDLRFGDIVAAQGWLSSSTLNFFVEQFPQLSTATSKVPLGQYLKTAGLLGDSHIEQILAEQDATKRRFGEIAVQRGLVPAPTVAMILKQLSRRDLAAS